MMTVEQGTIATLTGLLAGSTYKIAVQVVASNTLSIYSEDKIVTTNERETTMLDQLSESLNLPLLRTSVLALETETTDLKGTTAGLETPASSNKSNYQDRCSKLN